MSLGFSNSGIQYLIQQLFNIKPRFGKNNLLRNEPQRKPISNMCGEVFESIDKDQLLNLFSATKLNFGKCAKRKQILVQLNRGTSLLFLPATSQIYLQQRGFRTRASGNLKNQIGQKTNIDDPKMYSIIDYFRNVIQKFNKEKPLMENAEVFKSYKTDLEKMSEIQQKPFADGFLKGILATKANATQTAKKPSFLRTIGIFLLIVAIINYLTGFVKIRIGDRKIGSLLFSGPQEIRPEDVTVSFEDVRGLDEAKSEVEEIVNYLRDPERFSRLGGRLPKGVLLVGVPGTGKTLLARAIAGEAQVPFFHTSGSEFDELLVGQGARRIRDLFERAKERAPCIIFIDEIDSVGSKRVSNGIHPYANQTINQLLSEMDGFHKNEGIIVVGATNRVEDLDKALLRPGRFDVRVTVTKPDLAGRKDIFNFYLDKIVYDKKHVNVDSLAKGTTGFTGADIENMVNQAALKATTEGCTRVSMRHLDEARDRILMGPARMKGRFPDEETNRNTAYHEAGHTLVAHYTKDSTPLHKVTIIPRGLSMGHTAMLPEKDAYQVNRSQLLAQLDVTMGGRVAEELIFGQEKVTTGAADDLKKATQMATEMVKQFGMSDRVGLRDFTVNDSSSSSLITVNDRSPQTNEIIDQEISRLLSESYARAKEILTKHKKEHQMLAEALLEYETLTADEIRKVINGEKITRLVTQPAPLGFKIKNPKLISGEKKPTVVQIQID